VSANREYAQKNRRCVHTILTHTDPFISVPVFGGTKSFGGIKMGRGEGGSAKAICFSRVLRGGRAITGLLLLSLLLFVI